MTTLSTRSSWRALRPGVLLTALLTVAGSATVAAHQEAAAAAPSTVYVSTHGSNTAAGTSAHPLRSIQSAINKVRAGGRVVVRGGTYHENVTISGKPGITLEAAKGASVWMDGSQVVSGWTSSGAGWSTSWTKRFDASPTYTWGAPDGNDPNWTYINPAHPMASHPDQVWISGRAQAQVGSLSKLKAGKFFVDYGAKRLYVGTNPFGREVRASSLEKALSIRSANVLVRRINVRRYAPSVPHMGAVTAEQAGVRLQGMKINENATTGLMISARGVRLSRITTSRNGMMGTHASNADGLVINRLTANRNNLERFNTSPSAGGMKIGRTKGITVRNSKLKGNIGTGLWFDESSWNIKVYRARLIGNSEHGLSLEISGHATVLGSVIAKNGGNGVKVNDTQNVQLWNNTFVGNVRPINIVQDGRDADPNTRSYRDRSLPLTWRNKPVSVRNNVIAAPGAGSSCLLCVEDYSHRFSAEQLQVDARGNLYQRKAAPRWAVIWSRGRARAAVFLSVNDFHSATGQEGPGRLMRRAVVRSNYHLTARARAKQRIASPLPSAIARALHVRVGAKHLGAFF